MQDKPLYRALTFLAIGILILILSSLFNFIRFQDIYLYRAASTIERIIHHQETALEDILEDKNLIASVVSENIHDATLLEKLKDKPYYLFIYQNDEIVFWSNNEMLIRNVNLISPDGRRLVNVGNGYYEMIRKDYPNNITALGIIPVYRQYEWENKYLVSGFRFKQGFLNNVKLTLREDMPEMKKVTSSNGEFLFGVMQSQEKEAVSDLFNFFSQLLGIGMLFVAVSYLLGYFFFRFKRKLPVILVFLLFMLCIDRYINELGKFAFVKYADLFSDTLFASRVYGNSLGQFLLRSFLVLWFFIILNKYIRFSSLAWVKEQRGYVKWIVVSAGTAFYILILESITSLVLNSTISFEFFNFYNLSGYSLAGILALSFLLIALFLSIDIAVRLMNGQYFNIWWVAVPVIFLWQTYVNHEYWWVGLLLSSFLIFLLALVYFPWKERYALFRLLAILFVLSSLLSMMMVRAIKVKNKQLAMTLADELLVERSAREEIGFMEVVIEMSKDRAIRSYLKSPYINKIDLNEHIKSKFLRRYASKYEIQSYALRPEGGPLTGDIPDDLEVLLNKKTGLVATEVEHVYYVRNKEGGYLGIVPVYTSDSLLSGKIAFRLTQRLFNSFSAYPVLLQSNGSNTANQYEKFDFSVYDSTRLVRSKGSSSESAGDMNPGSLSESGRLIRYADKWEWQQKKDNRTVVISWKWTPLAYISLFSYTVFLLLVLVFIFETSRLTLGANKLNPFLKNFLHPSLQRNIQSSMILLVLLSLLIVGLVSLFFFKNQYGNYYNIRAVRQVNGLSKDISYLWDTEEVDSISAMQIKLLSNLQRLSEVAEVDINFFNSAGELLGTTQPDVFIKGLISEKINPQAYYRLGIEKNMLWQNEENIGKLKYTSLYLRVDAADGRLLGFLQCPFYEKQRTLNEDISYFLVSFVNLYVLLLLIAAIVAVILSGSITNSLTAIREHMGTFRIGRKNIPIALESKDEIGALVSEYNRMMQALEKSAARLAQSEREGAWKEMAKQVAHEIKNPLTPMKLSIQHLQRAVAEKRDDLPELTAKITSSLVEQIDTLAEIASAFSDFARMPVAQLEKLNLIAVLQTATGLFQEEDVVIQCELPELPVYIRADKNQLLRVFNNLIRNSVQAIQEKGEKGEKGEIKVKVAISENSYIISIQDNGSGIPPDKLEKIFQPNFTTKSSGTGLGLAISKSIIERLDGRIWLVSEEGKGTVFYIELPKIEEHD